MDKVKEKNEVMEEDPLDEIFVEKNQPADKKIIVDILKPYALIDNEGSINFEENYHNLSFWKKIIVYLVCRKAMVFREILENEEVGPTEISEKAEISLDSAKNISREKGLKGLVKKGIKGYYIPNYKLREAKNKLNEKEQNN